MRFSNCVMWAGGEAFAAACAALRIDDGGFAAEAVSAFGREGESVDGAGGDTTATAGAVCGDQEGGIFLLHAHLKFQVAFDKFFDAVELSLQFVIAVFQLNNLLPETRLSFLEGRHLGLGLFDHLA